MLSEGSAVLLSRHGASLASKPESFGFGRTFTDMTACPLTGHADRPSLTIAGERVTRPAGTGQRQQFTGREPRHHKPYGRGPVSYTHLRAHETRHDLVCRLLLEKKKNN